MKRSPWKAHLLKSFKIAVAAVLAIVVAEEIGLKFPVTAGIITVLTIRNTKKDTMRSLCSRALSYLWALVIAGALFGLLGFTLWSFALYLLIYGMLCLCMGKGENIVPVSVLIAHFLSEANMGYEMLANESLLLLIGSFFGFLSNLHLHKRESEFERLATEVDMQIKGILHRMSVWLPKEDKRDYKGDCFIGLEEALAAAKACAVENYENELFGGDRFSLEYISMRERQSVILKEIYENIVGISFLPRQALQVAGILDEIEQAYHRDNTVEELLQKMDGLLLDMHRQPLPVNREEFEARAILFYILKQIRNVLQIKRDFVLTNPAYKQYNHIQVETRKLKEKNDGR